jgi:beta-galactosidase
VVARDQYRMPYRKAPLQQDTTMVRKLKIVRNDDTLLIRNDTESLTFDHGRGMLVSFRYLDRELILEGPALNLWRPPTDNDLGNGMPARCAAWKHAWQESRIEERKVLEREHGSVEVVYSFTHPATGASYSVSYLVRPQGYVMVDLEFLRPSDNLPELPRLGLQMILPAACDSVSWFGRGPHESYWDRKTGAFIGHYEGTVWEQHHPYVRPQENGNKTDVRWMAVHGGDGYGLMAISAEPFSTSVQQYRQDDLEPAGKDEPRKHTNDIRPRDLITWNIDHRQMGVGGDNSWGARTHEAYTLKAQFYSLRFALVPFRKKITNPLIISKYNHE